MKLTERQVHVLMCLQAVCREQVFRYSGKCGHLFQSDLLTLVTKGDSGCAWGMGGLTWWVAPRLDLNPGQVLTAFKQLEAKGLVVREARHYTYQRPLYWWPLGLADEICNELKERGLN